MRPDLVTDWKECPAESCTDIELAVVLAIDPFPFTPEKGEEGDTEETYLPPVGVSGEGQLDVALGQDAMTPGIGVVAEQDFVEGLSLAGGGKPGEGLADVATLGKGRMPLVFDTYDGNLVTSFVADNLVGIDQWLPSHAAFFKE